MKHSIFQKIVETCSSGVAVSAATGAILLTTSCRNFENELSGVPAVDYLSESEARIIANKAFADRGIILKPDVDQDVTCRIINYSDSDSVETDTTVTIRLDGYNDSLGVGYEYNSGDDPDWMPMYRDTSGRVAQFSYMSSPEQLHYEIDQFVDELVDSGFVNEVRTQK